jgi:hypothetical protein
MTILAGIHSRKTYPLTQTGPVPGRILPVATKTITTCHRTKSAIPRPFTRLPQTSLVLVLTLFTIWTAVVVCVSGEGLLLLPRGLPIHVVRPGVIAPRSPGIQPLLVYLRDGRNPRPTLYVDSNLVAWEDFSALLKKELARRG